MRRALSRMLVAAVAVMSIIPLSAEAMRVDPIVVDPGAAGVQGDAFTASYIDFSYVASINQTATEGTGTFDITGGGFFSSFRHPDLATPVQNTGLNSNYQMYATFSGSGDVNPTPGLPGGLTATYTDFQMELFLDPDMNTQISSNGNVTATNTANDILVGRSTSLIAGEAHVFPGLANGDFAMLVNFEPVGGFLSESIMMNVTGVNTSITGVTPGTFTNGRIDGSGNVSFIIPEPTTLLLIGSGLAALGWLRRRQSV